MAGQLKKPETGLSNWWDTPSMTTLQDEMNQLFSRFFGNGGGLATRELPAAPSLDLSETDDEIEVRLDLPGYKPEEIEVDLSGDVLNISGEHQEETEEKEDGRRYHRIERRHGRFQRAVQLPAAVRDDQIDANFKDGVLMVKMPKAEESKAKKIPVKG